KEESAARGQELNGNRAELQLMQNMLAANKVDIVMLEKAVQHGIQEVERVEKLAEKQNQELNDNYKSFLSVVDTKIDSISKRLEGMKQDVKQREMQIKSINSNLDNVAAATGELKSEVAALKKEMEELRKM